MGKWIGASVALMVSATALSLYFILKGRNADVNIIGSLDMAWPFTLTGFIVMAHSFLQMCSVLHAGNGIVDGLLYATADFDNPAGVAATLTVTFPFMSGVKAYKECSYVKQNVFTIVVATVALALLALLRSRAGILAVGAVLLMRGLYKRDNFLRRLVFIITLVAATTVIIISVTKEGSNQGRTLILNVCMDMIKDKPLFGHGLHGFRRNYMLYQAKYLERCNSETFNLLADNVTHPLNEYFLLTVNFGIIGFLVIAVAVLMTLKHFTRQLYNDTFTGVSVLTGIAILSMFSYPFRYPLTLVGMICALFLVFRDQLSDSQGYIKKSVCTITTILSIIGLTIFVPWSVYQNKWGKLVRSSENNKTAQKALDNYSVLYRHLKNDPYFLYNYAYILAETGDCFNAVQIAQRSFKLMANYDTALFVAEQQKECGNMDYSEEYYKLASAMCPVRFIPLYGLFQLYEEQHRFDDMKQLGRSILAKPVKVQSAEIKRIRLAVRQKMVMYNL
ncbi:MAG: O-antigen ligase family protein [Bacteroidales bacterium]|jgi:hypothetical protein|nr:O-antigen ligase family protein [Bacteroidales bacterium]